MGSLNVLVDAERVAQVPLPVDQHSQLHVFLGQTGSAFSCLDWLCKVRLL